MNPESESGTKDVLDADEAATWLKIPKSTLYKLCTEGEVPAAKVGRHWRFHRETLENWFLEKTHAHANEDLCTDCPKMRGSDESTG